MTIPLDEMEKQLEKIYNDEIEKMERLGINRVAIGVFINLCRALLQIRFIKLREQSKWIADMKGEGILKIITLGTLKKDGYSEKTFFTWLNLGLNQAMEEGFEIKVEEEEKEDGRND